MMVLILMLSEIFWVISITPPLLILFNAAFTVEMSSGTLIESSMSAVITASPASAIYYPVERRAVFGGIRARF